MTSLFYGLLFSFVLFSCSSYVERWHEKIETLGSKNNATINPLVNSMNHSDQVHSSTITKNLMPRNRRKYGVINKRRTIDSLYDSGNEDSLWSGVGQENYLFTRNNIKKYGDIIVVDMGLKLKKRITFELARVFPNIEFELSGEKKRNNNNISLDKESDGKTYDRISSVIVEEVNKDHLMIQGKKEMLYDSKKRIVEIQALIARRDIGRSGSIHSDKILELMVSVVRR